MMLLKRETKENKKQKQKNRVTQNMEERYWSTHIWRGVEENEKQFVRMWKKHVLPMNPCVRIICKSKQLIIWAIIRNITLLTSLLCGSWSFTLPVTLFAGVRFFSRENSFKSSIQACRPKCRVTINCKFFTMASIERINQLLIVSYVLASGRDLVTPSRGSSESTGHQWRVKASDPTLATCPHSLTGTDCLGQWQAERVRATTKNMKIHAGLYAHKPT
jgi:hypothetical protein